MTNTSQQQSAEFHRDPLSLILQDTQTTDYRLQTGCTYSRAPHHHHHHQTLSLSGRRFRRDRERQRETERDRRSCAELQVGAGGFMWIYVDIYRHGLLVPVFTALDLVEPRTHSCTPPSVSCPVENRWRTGGEQVKVKNRWRTGEVKNRWRTGEEQVENRWRTSEGEEQVENRGSHVGPERVGPGRPRTSDRSLLHLLQRR
ncbi:uncharacterized protein LOC119497640 isoform X2 [Sebastes umbrosus]|uniref:uncharacterized protein LOC119497640 isoform X2 n=1 Tax=Sebastes umbrosus TaxID=72105 RepID=UPI00189CEDD9|nr:uncharacterized protein LOC119497640 isoform X2 [Sebastes umbrosus]